MQSKLILGLVCLMCSVIVNAQTSIIEANFFEKCNTFFEDYVNQGLINYKDIKAQPDILFDLIEIIEQADISELPSNTQKSFYINAYNLQVIKSVVLNYPIASVMDVAGFFDTEKHLVAQKKLTLNELENTIIRPQFNDARLHFALVCGAVACPPIIKQAYTPQNIEQLLNQQTKAAINNSDFIKINDEGASISKIFEWYASDFGNNKKQLLDFINQYAQKPLPSNTKITYYPYDWQLNEGNFEPTKNNIVTQKAANTSSAGQVAVLPQSAERYFVSALYGKGQFEVQIFNNFFTQKTKNPLDNGKKYINRNTFFTTYINALFGINPRLNIGFDAKIRSVALNTQTPNKVLEVFNFSNKSRDNFGSYTRFQPTALGPRVKYTPFKKMGNISVQQTLYFPLGKNLEGGNNKGFADWQGLVLWNQFFYDNPIGDKFSLFAEVDVLLENFTSAAFTNNYYWQYSTPITLIPSYFPTSKTIIYALVSSAPQWGVSQSDGTARTKSYVPYNQYGLGIKYQFTQNWLGEILYTEFISNTSQTARTFNVGLRYIKR